MINLLPQDMRKDEKEKPERSPEFFDVKIHRPDPEPEPEPKQHVDPVVEKIKIAHQNGKKPEVLKRKVVGDSADSQFSKFWSFLKSKAKKPELNLLLGGEENVAKTKQETLEFLTHVTKIVFVFVLLYGLLFCGARWFHLFLVNKQVDTFNKISLVKQDIEHYESDQSDLLKIKKRFSAVSSLLDQHVYWVEFFNHLEVYTLPKVVYGSLIAEEDGSVILSAQTDSFKSLAHQLHTFQNAPEFIKNVQINAGSVAGDDGSVAFTVNLTLADEFLLNK